MMAGVSAEQAGALLAAFDTLAADIDAVTELIEALPPGHRAFEAATELVDLLRDAVGAAAELRGRQAHRLRAAEGLSLARLAAVIRVSTPRAQQLDAVGRATIEEKP